MFVFNHFLPSLHETSKKNWFCLVRIIISPFQTISKRLKFALVCCCCTLTLGAIHIYSLVASGGSSRHTASSAADVPFVAHLGISFHICRYLSPTTPILPCNYSAQSLDLNYVDKNWFTFLWAVWPLSCQ